MKKRHISSHSRARGFTFVELVISVVVLAIAVTGVLLVFTQTVRHSADPLLRQQALAIAEAYVEEIVSRHYDDPSGGETFGAEAGETRANYDDVWDYDGLAGAPTRPDGTNLGMTDIGGYSVTVTVSDGTAELGVTAARVDVVVTHTASNIGISLWSYRTDYNTW